MIPQLSTMLTDLPWLHFGYFVLFPAPFWKLFGCCANSVTEGYMERMIARHSATLGSGAQARAGVIPWQSTASTDAPFSRSKRVTATIPCRDDRCSGLKQGCASTAVYWVTNAYPDYVGTQCPVHILSRMCNGSESSNTGKGC